MRAIGPRGRVSRSTELVRGQDAKTAGLSYNARMDEQRKWDIASWLWLLATTGLGIVLDVMSDDERMMGPLDLAGFALIAVGGIGGICIYLWLFMKRRR